MTVIGYIYKLETIKTNIIQKLKVCVKYSKHKIYVQRKQIFYLKLHFEPSYLVTLFGRTFKLISKMSTHFFTPLGFIAGLALKHL